MENVHDVAAAAFAAEGFTVVRHTKLAQEELEKELADTNIIGIRSKTMLPKEMLDKVDHACHTCQSTAHASPPARAPQPLTAPSPLLLWHIQRSNGSVLYDGL